MPSTHEGRRVLITGGGAGIGEAIATAFLREGARVHVCDIDSAALERLQASGQSEAKGAGVLGTTVADASSPADVDRLFEAVGAHLGGLDVLINNAGTSGPTGPVETLEIEDWRQTLRVNLDGQFLCARAAVPHLKAAGGGSITNLSSTAGIHGYPLRSPYATAKWGIIGFTKTLAMELGPHNIRVNAICPGSVAGDRIDRVIAATAEARGTDPADVREDWLQQVSMRTFVQPEDVAALVLFLASDAGSKISGQAIPVDGHTEGLGDRARRDTN